MIASSSDGGNTWNIRHSKRGGRVLLHIAFANDKIGHAAGKDGVLLSTIDGGKSWKSQDAGDDIQVFSFADALNGIAVIGGDNDAVTYKPNWAGTALLDGEVKLTHDGGAHWEQIAALRSEGRGAFKGTLDVAALDALHYLVIRRNPDIEDAFFVTGDGGNSWKIVHQRNDETNRELARWVFVHGGEYWVFGMELLHREKGGGYGFPLAEHSKDGMTWVHGASGEKEFGGCNPEGCYIWAGAVESLYGSKEQYWNLPQDFTLTNTWAIAANRACTINTSLECGPAVATDKPQPMIWHAGGGQFDELPIPSEKLAFSPDCLNCSVKRIRLDPGLDWNGQAIARFDVDGSGHATNVSLNGKLDLRLSERIDEQMRQWTLKVSEVPKHEQIIVDINCISLPDTPAIDGCRLSPGKQVGNVVATAAAR